MDGVKVGVGQVVERAESLAIGRQGGLEETMCKTSFRWVARHDEFFFDLLKHRAPDPKLSTLVGRFVV